MTKLAQIIALGLTVGLVACASTVSEQVPEDVLEKPPTSSVVSPNVSDSVPGTPTAQPDASAQQPDASAQQPDAPVCNNAGTQTEMNACADKDYKRADAELNQVYQSLRSQQPKSGKQALESAEAAWISFRDLDCAFAGSQFEGGSVEPMVYSGCMSDRTKTRVKELQPAGPPEGSYEEADAQLNQAYESVGGVLSEVRKSELTQAQLSWLEYRDYSCAFEVDYSPTATDKNQCLARLSETRAAQLQAAYAQNNR